MIPDSVLLTIAHAEEQSQVMATQSDNLADKERNRDDKAFLEKKAQYWQGYSDAMSEVINWIRSCREADKPA